MSIFKRLSAFFLAVFAVMTLSACGKSNTYGEDTRFSLSSLEVVPSETQNSSLPASGGAVQVFTVLREIDAEPNFAASGIESDFFSKTVYERNAMIFDEYGIEINEIVTTDIVRYVKTEELSGSEEFDMIVLSAAGSAATLMNDGYLADLGSISGFDKNAKGYYPSAIESLSLSGKTYLAAGDAVPSFIRSASVVLLNTEMFAKIGNAEELSLLAQSGGFTYETMISYSGQYAALTGEADSDLSVRAGAEDAYPLFLAAGGSFMEKDKTGDMPFSPDFGTDMADAYRCAMRVLGFDPDASDGEEQTYAEGGMPLFTIATVSEYEALRAEGAPFMILPMPKMSASQAGYVCSSDLDRASLTAIPAGGKDNENAVSIMNLIYARSGNVVSLIDDGPEFELVKRSVCGDLLSAFEYADIDVFMRDCASEKTPTSDFLSEAAKRSKAAVAALSIVAKNLS